MCRLLFFWRNAGASRPQHHLHAVKAVKSTPITRPSTWRLVGRSSLTKKARIAFERELGARALQHWSEEATGPRGGGEEGCDLEVSDSENESDVESNQ